MQATKELIPNPQIHPFVAIPAGKEIDLSAANQEVAALCRAF